MAGLVLGPRSLSAISVLFLIEKHFTFMFIRILLSVRYATHIKWFLKLFLELPWKEGSFEDTVSRALPSPQLHHHTAISSAAERDRKGHDKGAQGIHCFWKLPLHLKNWNFKILVEGRSLSNSPSFLWLWQVEEFQPLIQQALIASFMFQAWGTVVGAGRMQKNAECQSRGDMRQPLPCVAHEWRHRWSAGKAPEKKRPHLLGGNQKSLSALGRSRICRCG